MKIPAKEISNHLRYDDNEFYWVGVCRGGRRCGAKAGTYGPRGNLSIEIFGINYQASHLSWALQHGEYPAGRLHHLDGDIGNIRPDNLVLVKNYCPDMTQELVKDLFIYRGGKLFWRRKPTTVSQCNVGGLAGHLSSAKDNEYWYIKAYGKQHKRANLVWLYHYGRLPKVLLDHINRDKADDRVENLREATHRENARNRTLRYDSTSGVVGVTRTGNRWWARISLYSGERLDLGRFDTKAEAVAARKAAESLLGYN